MKTALKWAVGLSLMAALLLMVDLGELWKHLQRVNYGIASIAFVLLTLQFPLSSWKWSWALRMHGLQFGHLYLFRVLLVGFLFNNFLPTSIGGDIYRVFRTAPPGRNWSRAFSAVATERITGLVLLFALGAIGAILLAPQKAVARSYLVIFFLGACVGAIGLLALYRGWLKPLTRHLRKFRIFDAIEDNLSQVLRFRKEWLPLLGLSALFQAIAILIVHVLYLGLGQDVSIADCALIASAAAIATILPVSINGLGVVEATFAGAAVALGVNFESSVIVPILIRVLVLPHGLAAGIVYLADRGDADQVRILLAAEPRQSEVAVRTPDRR